MSRRTLKQRDRLRDGARGLPKTLPGLFNFDELANLPDTDLATAASLRFATIVVAASDSQLGTATADYTCTGTNDETTINTALAALPSSIGGRVVLLEGNYHVAGSIVIPHSYVTFEGQGGMALPATIFRTGTAPIISADATVNNLVISNLGLDGGNFAGNGITCTSPDNSVFDSLLLENCGGYGIEIGPSGGSTTRNVSIRSCFVQSPFGGSGSGIYARVITEGRITDCDFNCGTTGVGILFESSYGNVVEGNQFNGCGTAVTQGVNSGGNVLGSKDITVVGNYFADNTRDVDTGVSDADTTTGHFWIVSDNFFLRTTQESIRIDYNSSKDSYWQITDNTFESCGAGTNNTYDTIAVTNGNYNHIQGNLLRRDAALNQPRYGIRINSGTGNFVFGNDAYHAGATDDISDAGTGSVIQANRTTTGFAGSTPSGAAGGDLTGTYPNPTVADAAVSYAKIQDTAAASVLIGRGSAAGAGDVQELTLGAGLSMAGTVLSGSGASGGTPALTFSTTNAAGVSGTFIRDDDQLALFDTTVPVTQAFGDAAAVGTASVAARRDHKHGMPTAPSGTSAVQTRLTLDAGQRLSVLGPGDRQAGTVVIGATNVAGTVIAGTPRTPTTSFTVPAGYYLGGLGTVTLGPNIQATLEGTAELEIQNLSTTSRLNLVGRG